MFRALFFAFALLLVGCGKDRQVLPPAQDRPLSPLATYTEEALRGETWQCETKGGRSILLTVQRERLYLLQANRDAGDTYQVMYLPFGGDFATSMPVIHSRSDELLAELPLKKEFRPLAWEHVEYFGVIILDKNSGAGHATFKMLIKNLNGTIKESVLMPGPLIAFSSCSQLQ